jgi:hypothetical protein
MNFVVVPVQNFVDVRAPCSGRDRTDPGIQENIGGTKQGKKFGKFGMDQYI